MDINKDMLKELETTLNKYGYTKNGFESDTKFMTIGYLGKNKLFLKFKELV